MSVQPLRENERIATLDMMRGVALLGIAIANSIHFQYGLFPTESIHELYRYGTIDRLAEKAIVLFAEASFYPLFSFLFGYGIVLLKERLEQKAAPFSAIYWRRMIALLLIGYVHSVYVWDGDILFVYALAGFLLYFYLKLHDRSLLIWACLFLLLMASAVAIPEDEETASVTETLQQYSIEELHVLSEGSYQEIVTFRREADPLGFGIAGEIIMTMTSVLSVIGLFLLGAFSARKKWLENIENYRTFTQKVFWMTLIIGFPCKLAYVIVQTPQTEMLHLSIGGPTVAICYAAAIALIASKRPVQPLVRVGRLSLTNYLMQSFLFTTLFYSYGFALFNSLGVFVGLCISIFVFLLQILFSSFWLKYFYFGPFEWLWRIMTYWQIPRLKR